MDHRHKQLVVGLTSFQTTTFMQLLGLLLAATCLIGNCLKAREAAPSQVRTAPDLEILREIRTDGPVAYLAWSPNGRELAGSILGKGADLPTLLHIPSPFGGEVTIWDSEGHVAQQIRQQQSFFSIGESFAFVNNGTQLAVTSPVAANDSTFEVFDIKTGNLIRSVPSELRFGKETHLSRASLLVASPSQSLVAAVFPGVQPVAIYSTDNWAKVADLPEGPSNPAEQIRAIAFSPNGNLLAALIANAVRIYDVTSRAVIKTIRDFPRGDFGDQIAFSPDGRSVVVGMSGVTSNTPIRVFDIADGSTISAYSGGPHPTQWVGWLSGGRYIAFVTGFRHLHVWNPLRPDTAGRTVELSARADCLAFAVSPSGDQVAADTGRSVVVFGISP